MNHPSFTLEMFPDMLQGFSDRLFSDDIRVEGQVNCTVFKRDIVPVGKKGDTAELVPALESPDPGNGDGAGPFGCQGIGLFRAFRNPQRNLGIPYRFLGSRRAVESIRGASRRLVLDRFAADIRPGMVGPELESRLFAIHRPERDEDTGSSLLGGRIADFLKFTLAQEAPVAPFFDHIDTDAAALAKMTIMVTHELWDSL